MRPFSIIALCLISGCSPTNTKTEISTAPSAESVAVPNIEATPLGASKLFSLHSDEEVEKLIKEKDVKETLEGLILFRVNANKSVPRSEVFKDLGIDEKRIYYQGWGLFNYALMLDWQISPSYAISCHTSVSREISGNKDFDFDIKSGNPPSLAFRICEVRIGKLSR